VIPHLQLPCTFRTKMARRDPLEIDARNNVICFRIILYLIDTNAIEVPSVFHCYILQKITNEMIC